MMSLMSWRRILVFFTVLVAAIMAGWAEESGTTAEIEITGDWIRTIEPELANPKSSGKPDIYDRLAFGKGRFVRIEGKSRKSVVLKLEGDTKCAVRLFDLPVLDTKALSSKGDYYFGGILSKVDRDTQGVIEVTLTYSNLSEVAGRFY
jgi:hypothetical protein